MTTLGRRRILQGAGVALAFSPHRAAGADADAAARPVDLVRQARIPQDYASPTTIFERLITPTPAFFVRSHFGPPALDRERPLRIGGLVGSPRTFTAAELKKAFREVTVTAVLQCAGNGRAFHSPRVPGVQWTHGAMGQATFTGARLKDVLESVGMSKDAAHVHAAGADLPPKPTVPAFLRSLPLARALDPTTLIAWGMNGEDLTHAHGAPLRLVVPGWAGDHWVKWLTRLEPAKEEAGGFFMTTAYRMPTEPVEPGAAVPPEKMAPATTFPVKSVIGAPGDGAKVPRGPQSVVGIAFSGVAPIAKVEVSVDGGKTWKPAKLEGEAGVGRWNVFRYDFVRGEPGTQRAMARATDKKGNVQPEHPAWNPSGYFWNGWHSVAWEVT